MKLIYNILAQSLTPMLPLRLESETVVYTVRTVYTQPHDMEQRIWRAPTKGVLLYSSTYSVLWYCIQYILLLYTEYITQYSNSLCTMVYESERFYITKYCSTVRFYNEYYTKYLQNRYNNTVYPLTVPDTEQSGPIWAMRVKICSTDSRKECAVSSRAKDSFFFF